MNKYRGRPILRRTMLAKLKSNWISLLLLAYGLIITLRLVQIQIDNDAEAKKMERVMEEKTASMAKLLDSKSREKLMGGLGLEYSKGKKCPYKWNGGSPGGEIKGSCWCGLDSYCMCTPSLAIDAILEVPGSVAKPGKNDNDPYILVVRRRDPPKDKYAIPGGFVNVGESLEYAVMREVKEETNIELRMESLEEYKVYSDPWRDSRRHTVSVVYRTVVKDISNLKKGDDAKGIELIRLLDLFNPEMSLAFDHAQIFHEYTKKFHPHLIP